MMLSDSRKINIAIIGCGAITELFYVPALTAIEKANSINVKALFDPNSVQVANIEKHFPAASRIDKLSELSNIDIDLAIVASPVHYHAEQTIEILGYDISVLCEKPMATTAAEAEKMIRGTSGTQAIIAVGLFRRFFPAARAIRDVLSLNVLGKVKTFRFFEGYKFAWPARSASFFQKAGFGGGVLLDYGVHVLDLLIWWFGEPTLIRYEDDAMGGLEANCALHLEFPQGVEGRVKLSRDWPLPNECIIECENGWLNWPVDQPSNLFLGFHDSHFALNAQLYESSGASRPLSLGLPGYTFEQSFIAQIQNVVRAVRGTEAVFVPGQEGIKSLRLIENCYLHQQLMCIPWLSEEEHNHAKQLKEASS